MKSAVALLSFDIEEFDLPTEYGRSILLEDQLSVSVIGLRRVLALLAAQGIRATFYSTVVFAENNAELIREMVARGHEIASHGCCHGVQLPEHLKQSKNRLEEITATRINGYRAPRMGAVSAETLSGAGYKYNSSMNPTLIPGRYNNLSQPRSLFRDGELVQLPASVGYPFRFPLFWLSFNNLLPFVYRIMARSAMNRDGYLNIYFHPWEFNEQIAAVEYGVPTYIKRHAGAERVARLSGFIGYLKRQGVAFQTTTEYLKL